MRFTTALLYAIAFLAVEEAAVWLFTRADATETAKGKPVDVGGEPSPTSLAMAPLPAPKLEVPPAPLPPTPAASTAEKRPTPKPPEETARPSQPACGASTVPRLPGLGVDLFLDPALSASELSRFVRETRSCLVWIRHGIGQDGEVYVKDARLPDSVTGLPQPGSASQDEIEIFLKEHSEERCIWVALDIDRSSILQDLASEREAFFRPYLVLGEKPSAQAWTQRAAILGAEAETSRETMTVKLVVTNQRVDVTVELEDNPNKHKGTTR